MQSTTSLSALVQLTRTRAKRHHMAMIRCERADNWKRAALHSATLDNMVSLENDLNEAVACGIQRHQI